MRAIIKESGREVDVEINGNEFWVIRRLTKRDRVLSTRAIAGPFNLNDSRFILKKVA
jgi:hypothetical protein